MKLHFIIIYIPYNPKKYDLKSEFRSVFG